MTYIDIFTWISKHSCFSYTNTSNVSTKKNNVRKQKDSSRVKKCFNKHLSKSVRKMKLKDTCQEIKKKSIYFLAKNWWITWHQSWYFRNNWTLRTPNRKNCILNMYNNILEFCRNVSKEEEQVQFFNFYESMESNEFNFFIFNKMPNYCTFYHTL